MQWSFYSPCNASVLHTHGTVFGPRYMHNTNIPLLTFWLFNLKSSFHSDAFSSMNSLRCNCRLCIYSFTANHMLKFHLERGGVIVSTLQHTYVQSPLYNTHTYVQSHIACYLKPPLFRFLELWQLQLATSIISSSFHFFTSLLQVKRSFSYQNTCRLRALRVWSHSSLAYLPPRQLISPFADP